MTFISYAQNLEDVILWRALRHIDRGFYIDVGAAWPDEHSVTKAFYDQGWHGINIEPNSKFNIQLSAQRPRDLNFEFAIGDTEGTFTMRFIPDSGLSTLDDATAAVHQNAGWSICPAEVQVRTLSSVWHEHVPPGQDVHFLKIDVEGYEEAVLRGSDFGKHRPWVVIVEATKPLSQAQAHVTWESILLKADYQFAYADGLNRFYVAKEHFELLPAFNYPPNVFDGFKLIGQHDAEARAAQAEARAAQAEDLTYELINSTSWRLTAPLRWAGVFVRRFYHMIHGGIESMHHINLRVLEAYRMIFCSGLGAELKILGHARRQESFGRFAGLGSGVLPFLTNHLRGFVFQYPVLFNPFLRLLRRYPEVYFKLKGAMRGVWKGRDMNVEEAKEPLMALNQLPTGARQIFTQLQAAISTQREGHN